MWWGSESLWLERLSPLLRRECRASSGRGRGAFCSIRLSQDLRIDIRIYWLLSSNGRGPWFDRGSIPTRASCGIPTGWASRGLFAKIVLSTELSVPIRRRERRADILSATARERSRHGVRRVRLAIELKGEAIRFNKVSFGLGNIHKGSKISPTIELEVRPPETVEIPGHVEPAEIEPCGATRAAWYTWQRSSSTGSRIILDHWHTRIAVAARCRT